MSVARAPGKLKGKPQEKRSRSRSAGSGDSSTRGSTGGGETPRVGIIMGSQSDWQTMHHAADLLTQLGVAHETRIVSAHRTPKRMVSYAEGAKARGIQVIIAGAGGAAHLPGMTAALTDLPVLGVPVESAALKGQDSLLSIVQMPAGIPVGTLAIGRAGAVNAALLAAAILALNDATLAKALARYRAKQTAGVADRPVHDTPAAAGAH
jgi:5-(carboxyamino)imidazole ribonucleotide mutase